MASDVFSVLNKDGDARVGNLHTKHGALKTPAFIPVGTQGTVKTISPADLKECGVDIVLSNAYHLYLRPGCEVIKEAGGLHKFMRWDGPILTDSGGYQVFSLAVLRKVKPEGVEFQSHIDGSLHLFTPQKVMDIQASLGSDIFMPIDECIPYPCEESYARESLMITNGWARQSKEYTESRHEAGNHLFAILQGGVYLPLRKEAAETLVELEFPGYAVGGLSVGEPKELMYDVIEDTLKLLPEGKPRYLMGIGEALDILKGVSCGADLFDCVMPTRYGRNGTAFTRHGRMVLRNAPYARDFKPVEEGCDCYTCRN
ncbi:MAG: tRNA guanosine(34) transglycosylase Tgt, partial [Deltaproteobacteria bacterium]|nr:tRNA guanosine(34) transglycosylase Tgt [Deltaproteobacteria bacterium]